MESNSDKVFLTPPVDGISLLPSKPGIYAMLNRVTRIMNVGQAEDIRSRCVGHRSQLRAGIHPNLRMRPDAESYGANVYFYHVLELLEVNEGMNIRAELNALELWWAVQLQVHIEQYGYISSAGGYITRGARFRDRERKLMRLNSRKYQLLPGVDLYDPIHPVLLAAWVPGS